MNRPLYETAHDLLNETRVAKALEQTWQCQVVKLKRAYAVDYSILTGRECRALAEIKVRRYSMAEMSRMGGFMLSLHKWSEANVLAKSAGVPFLVVVEAAGEVHWHRSDGQHDGVSFGGRTDRDDPEDVEPVILLQAQRFRPLVSATP